VKVLPGEYYVDNEDILVMTTWVPASPPACGIAMRASAA
jgi:hypothetical protein